MCVLTLITIRTGYLCILSSNQQSIVSKHVLYLHPPHTFYSEKRTKGRPQKDESRLYEILFLNSKYLKYVKDHTAFLTERRKQKCHVRYSLRHKGLSNLSSNDDVGSNYDVSQQSNIYLRLYWIYNLCRTEKLGYKQDQMEIHSVESNQPVG